MPAEGRSCCGCLNWQPIDSQGYDVPRGECRCCSPNPAIVDGWPITLADQWCGEWRPLPVVQGKPKEAT